MIPLYNTSTSHCNSQQKLRRCTDDGQAALQYNHTVVVFSPMEISETAYQKQQKFGLQFPACFGPCAVVRAFVKYDFSVAPSRITGQVPLVHSSPRPIDFSVCVPACGMKLPMNHTWLHFQEQNEKHCFVFTFCRWLPFTIITTELVPVSQQRWHETMNIMQMSPMLIAPFFVSISFQPKLMFTEGVESASHTIWSKEKKTGCHLDAS